jgi:hypothetical protein
MYSITHSQRVSQQSPQVQQFMPQSPQFQTMPPPPRPTANIPPLWSSGIGCTVFTGLGNRRSIWRDSDAATSKLAENFQWILF